MGPKKQRRLFPFFNILLEHLNIETINFVLQEIVAKLDRAYHDHLDFHEAQQDSEKWLLQMSFKLMSHNSLNVSSMEITQRQLDKHLVSYDNITSIYSNFLL